MKTHVTIVSVLHLVFSIIGILVGFFLAGMMALGGAISGDDTALAILSGFGAFFVVLFVIMAIPGIIGAIGALKGKNWGRIVLIVVGIFNLPGLPVGTALGIYTLWTFFHDETRALFEGSTVTG